MFLRRAGLTASAGLSCLNPCCYLGSHCNPILPVVLLEVQVIDFGFAKRQQSWKLLKQYSSIHVCLCVRERCEQQLTVVISVGLGRKLNVEILCSLLVMHLVTKRMSMEAVTLSADHNENVTLLKVINFAIIKVYQSVSDTYYRH